MNDRIVELAKQAGLKFPSEAELSPAEQKFAEFIVRECAAIAWWKEQYDEGKGPISKLIEKHFGVK